MEKSALSSVSSKILTVLNVIGVGREAQGGGTVLAFKAAPMEKLALGAQPLHHVDPLLAKIARVAASQVLRKLLLYGALWEGGEEMDTSRQCLSGSLPGGARPSL